MEIGWDPDWGWVKPQQQQQRSQRRRTMCSSPPHRPAAVAALLPPPERVVYGTGAESQVNFALPLSWSSAEEVARTTLAELGYVLNAETFDGWNIVSRSTVNSELVLISFTKGIGDSPEANTDVVVRVAWATCREAATMTAKLIEETMKRYAAERSGPFDFRSVQSHVMSAAQSMGRTLLDDATRLSTMH